MADKGIIFSAPMVRALLDGRKTQTRRLLKPQPHKWEARVIDIGEPMFDDEYQQWGQWETIWNRCSAMWEPEEEIFHPLRLPYYPSDRLYVREAHHRTDDSDDSHLVGYDFCAGPVPREDRHHVPNVGDVQFFAHSLGGWGGRSSRNFPSIHMPRWASRLWLNVTDVRVQRLQEISEQDAKAEGIIEYEPTEEDPAEFAYRDGGAIWNNARSAFQALWNSLHTKPGETWDDNPWIVAVTFEVNHGNIDATPPRSIEGEGL